MLSSIPVEVQTPLLFYLPRKDLAAVARVSQHLHAVAIKILYLKVELKTWSHLDSFFLPGSLIPSGSITATEHAEARRTHWESIGELSIHIADLRFVKVLIPRSLKGMNVQRLQLERLRFTSDGKRTDGHLLLLLECLNPKELHFTRLSVGLPESFLSSLSEVAWNRLEHVSFCLAVGYVPPASVAAALARSPPYKGVTSAALFLDVSSWIEDGYTCDDAVEFALRVFPSLQRLRLVVQKQARRDALAPFFAKGFGGKGAGFFTVEVGDPRTFGRE